MSRHSEKDFYMGVRWNNTKKSSRDWRWQEKIANQIVLGFAASTYYFGLFIVYCIAIIIDSLEWIAIIYLYCPATGHDEASVGDGITMPVKFQYGEHWREYGHIVAPKNPTKERKVLVYIHGGGFVAANSGVLIQSITGFVRKGFEVYCINYRRDPFPAGLCSVLKAMRWLHDNEGLRQVGVFGDSAGGNLAFQAVACMCNPGLLEDLRREFPDPTDTPLEEYQFPEVCALASICGLLDRSTFTKARLTSVFYVENLFMLLMCQFCVWVYESKLPPHLKNWGVNIPFSRFERLPPTFLAAGQQDPLIASSVLTYNNCRAAGFEVDFRTYYGRHVFFGFPTWWTCGNWRISAQPCFQDLSNFFLRQVGEAKSSMIGFRVT